MAEEIDKLIDTLHRRGFHPSGIAYVLGLLADEHPEGSPRREAWIKAQQDFLDG